ncbi:V-type ATP synthase subunit I [bacterium]|nr:V-type ATP synthase subunit I [bacterium]
MGTAKVEKVLIATHIEEREALLKTLQEEGILHISETSSLTEEGEEGKEGLERTTEDKQSEEVKDTLTRLSQAITFLTNYAGKRKGGGLFSQKPQLPLDEFNIRVTELDIPRKIRRVGELTEMSSALEKEERTLRTELELLEPWTGLKNAPADYTNLKKTSARFVHATTKDEFLTFMRMLEATAADVESVDESRGMHVVLFHTQETERVEDAIKSAGLKTFQLERFAKPIREEIEHRRSRMGNIKERREGLITEARQMSAELSGFETALDFYDNERLRKEESGRLARSEKAAFIEGWVRSRDRKKLEKIVHEFSASDVVPLTPAEDEQYPVALDNAPVIKPFEMLMNLYGSPDGSEADPTPFMTPFFAVFFGLCMTDAGYGLIITLTAAFLIWVKKIRGNLIWILFYGGITTIIGGALTSSWFGNLPDMLGMPWLVKFRDALTWFDPIKDPMPFLYLSLAAGYLQMVFGVAIEFFDNLRLKNLAAALFEALPWLLIFISVPLLVASGMAIIPGFLSVPLLILILVSAGVSIVLSNRPGPTSVTSAILFWAVVTMGLVALAKAAGGLPFPGRLLKGLLLGSLGALWLYTVFKGLSEKTLKAAGIIIGALGLACTVLYVTGLLGSNGFLIVVFIINILFPMMVLKGWGTRIAWGAYGIYSNATGVLGIVLSYVRLMALGMMTAGIATAFNLIAWMLGGIPVVSVILILAVLVIGHGYNLVMSALGAFVHSLRLQYVEFFPRFFSGGGLRFEPFELKTRYINVTRRT